MTLKNLCFISANLWINFLSKQHRVLLPIFSGFPFFMMKSRMRSYAFALLSLAAVSCLRGQEIPLPEGAQIAGPADQSAGWLTAKENGQVTISGKIPEKTPVLVVRGRVGNGKGKGISIQLNGAQIHLNQAEFKIPGGTYPDVLLFALFRTAGKNVGGADYWVRPNPAFYTAEEWQTRKEAWEKLPGASEREFTLEVRLGKELSVWLEGQFIGDIAPEETPENATEYKITVKPDGGAIHSVGLQAAPSHEFCLPVAEHSRVQGEATVLEADGSKLYAEGKRVPVAGMPEAKLVFASGAKVPGCFQDLAGKEASGIAVGGLGTIPGLANGYLSSLFFTRHAMDNLPEQRMFSVPLATYAWADVLCAVDDDPTHVNQFTFRVTRYGSSRGDAMADSLVEVPRTDSAPSRKAKRVGTVTYGPEGARKTAALWLIRVPIRNGQIEDLLHKDTMKNRYIRTYRYLDVDLLDPLAGIEEADVFPAPLTRPARVWEPTSKIPVPSSDIYTVIPPLSPTSGVTVFGLKLVKSPAVMTVESKPGCKAFYASEDPELIAKVRAAEAGEYTVRWQFADVDGKEMGSGQQVLRLGTGAEETVSVPLKQGNGWYAARIVLAEAKAGDLLDRRTSFVMLPPDTPKAGFESPFYGWWFATEDAKLDEVGPLLQRAGIRRAQMRENMPEAQSKAYGLTDSHIGWFPEGSGRTQLKDFTGGKKTLTEALAAQESYIRKQLELWPGIDRMLVFHESNYRGAPIASELWGEPAKPVERDTVAETSPDGLLAEHGAVAEANRKAQQEYWKNWPQRIEYLTAMGQMVREKFPQLKMQYGNDGDSLRLVGEIFRQKFPRKWIDTVAVEDLGQTFMPERALPGGLHSAWFLRELARKMGYGDVPVTACIEWIGRMSLKLGNRKQAEWKTRDGLLALAYGFDTISIAGLDDHRSAYYFSSWANGNLCSRYPEMAPKPAYAAVATLTRMLDSAQYRRFLDTGSTVLYAEEFQRGDEWIYVLWTPRGEREATLEFPSAETLTLTDLYGREKTVEGKSLKLKIGTGPQYLVSKEQLLTVTPGLSTFPEDQVPEKTAQVIPLERLSDINIVSNNFRDRVSRGQPGNLPQMREGKFEIREVEDPEMGKCIEVELKPEGELPWAMVHEYACLQLAHPVKSAAKNAGVWIKGNGSWGQVILEKTPGGLGPWANFGNRHFTWPGDGTLNFDGWNFIRYPYYDWTRVGDYSLTGITLTIPRKALVGTEMHPVKSLKVRIKSIVLY